MRPHIFIATPTSRDTTMMPFTGSITRITNHLSKSGIGWSFPSVDGADLAAQRDALASAFLESPSTHCLMVDSDMDFEHDLIDDLLKLRAELVGAAYPKRSLDLDRLRAELKRGLDFDRAVAAAYTFTIRALPDGRVIDRGNGVYIVGGIGMGFTLIDRAAFDRLVPTAATYRNSGGKITYSFFNYTQTDRRLTEDFSFCERFIAAGGEVLAYSTTKVGHYGATIHRASFADHVAARA